jgi:aldehyde dehydrogenase (NAD+)
VLAQVAAGDAHDVDDAVKDAARAFEVWGDMVPSKRGRILNEIARKLRDRIEEFAELETLDNGKPLAQARGDVEGSARYFEFFAGAADKIDGDTIPLGPDYLAYTLPIPYGIVGQILPWNAPLQQAARGLAPALVAGNVVVVKPAEDTPMSALALAELALDCGMPPGVMNVVTGLGETAGDALTRHPMVRKIAFTGSVPTGRIVNLVAADRIIPTTLELGGKSANIIFDDADVQAAAAGAAKGINLNAGQNCSAGSRLLVQAGVYDEVVARLIDHNKTVTVGPGLSNPDMGPITTAEQFERVKEYLQIAADEGAEIVTGGSSLPDRSTSGYFIDPTIMLGVNNQMRVSREEIFGPVVGVQRFDTEEEALRIANDSDYGLVAGVWSTNLSRVHRIARRLDVGQVYVNEYYAGFPGGVETPFGGSKNSGIGREKGLEAILHYTQTRAVVARLT